jgi:predicted dehydrogenase
MPDGIQESPGRKDILTRQANKNARSLRIGVAGLGNMGQHHVRVLAELDEVDLVAVSDPLPEARERVTRSRRVRAYASYEEMLDREELDALTIAVPTSMHEDAALAAIETGTAFLLEKPLAPTVKEATRIVEAAEAAGVLATVGHIERFNPVVQAAKRGVAAGEIGRLFQLRAIRTGPLPDRIQDVGVVVDLATHDIDVIRYLVGEPVERVFAETARRIHSEHEDLATSLMRFMDGTIGVLDVNWLTPVKIRELTILGEGGMYRLDYLNQDLYFYENSHVGYWSDFTGRKGVSEGNMVKYRIDRAEPLQLELEGFVAALNGTKGRQLVPLADGVNAVAVAAAVKLSAKLHRAVLASELVTEREAAVLGS